VRERRGVDRGFLEGFAGLDFRTRDAVHAIVNWSVMKTSKNLVWKSSVNWNVKMLSNYYFLGWGLISFRESEPDPSGMSRRGHSMVMVWGSGRSPHLGEPVSEFSSARPAKVGVTP
jgi:hypothetical protein